MMKKALLNLFLILGLGLLSALPVRSQESTAMGSVITDGNYQPLAIEAEADVVEGREIAISLSAFDADGDELLFSLVDDPVEGMITSFDPFIGEVIYQAAVEGSEMDVFSFAAFDGVRTSEPANVVITVLDSTGVIFADGFESGDVDAWSSAQPAAGSGDHKSLFGSRALAGVP